MPMGAGAPGSSAGTAPSSSNVTFVLVPTVAVPVPAPPVVKKANAALPIARPPTAPAAMTSFLRILMVSLVLVSS